MARYGRTDPAPVVSTYLVKCFDTSIYLCFHSHSSIISFFLLQFKSISQLILVTRWVPIIATHVLLLTGGRV